ncbi:unnamed protein product [Linum trigynum]|uniref:CBM20 domain-containing protein n=1 Tax=Linum trigynum TaxID=586398 RepID=A0AAV2DYT9_9ROSI
MEAIGVASSSSIVVLHSNGTRSLFSSSTVFNLDRCPLSCFLPAKKKVTGDFLKHSISSKLHGSLSAISASASLSQQEAAQVDLEDSDSEAQIQETEERNVPSVRVKFLLQKECSFGEQFVLVGDESVLGLWEPENGVPLDWSDGHVWAVELDIPIGKTIKYKFILKGPDGSLLWQPDPDRVLEPWETQGTIVVLEDWEDPLVQKIMEEEAGQTSQSVAVNEEPVTDEEETPNPVVDDSGLPVKAGTLALQETETVTYVKEEEEPSASVTEEEAAADKEEDIAPVPDSTLQIATESLAPRESQPVLVSAHEVSFLAAKVCAATQLEKAMASVMADDSITRHPQGGESITQNGKGQVSGESMNDGQKVDPVFPLSNDNVEDGDESVDGILLPEEAGLAVLVPGLLSTVQESPTEEEAREDEGIAIAVDASSDEVQHSGEEKSIRSEYDKEEAKGEGIIELLPKEEKVKDYDNGEDVDGDDRAPPVMNLTITTGSSDGILEPEQEGVTAPLPGLSPLVLETPSEEEATGGEQSVTIAFDASVDGANNNDVENPSGEEKTIALEYDKEQVYVEEPVALPEEKDEEEEKPNDDGVEEKSTSASDESRCKFPTPSGETENVLQNDMQWVQKLLSNLGLL